MAHRGPSLIFYKNGFMEDAKCLRTSEIQAIKCQPCVLLCHQKATLSVLWKTDCCLLFTVGAVLHSCGHSWSSPPECHSTRRGTTLPCLLSMHRLKWHFRIWIQSRPLKAEGCKCVREICYSLMAYYHPICNSDQL